jgi:hypothetical protein
MKKIATPYGMNGENNMSRCNYCSLKEYKRRAKTENKKLIMKPSHFGSFGGTDIFLVPKDIKVDLQDKKVRDNYFVSWCMEIPDKCMC